MANLILEDGWNAWSPRETLKPLFIRENELKFMDRHLSIKGNGNINCFGAWRKTLPVNPGKFYTFHTEFNYRGMEDPNLHILNMLVWQYGNKALADCPSDYVDHIWMEDGHYFAEQTFRAPDRHSSVEVMLYLRFTGDGEVWWTEASLTESSSLPDRPVTVATFRGQPPSPSTRDKNRMFWQTQIDELMKNHPKVDLILLPEFINGAAIPNVSMDEIAEPIPGPLSTMLSDSAKYYQSYVCGNFTERQGNLLYNTSVLFDRHGTLIGAYRKIHLYFPEEVMGISPGDDLPVFSTDFGKVGIMTCYDSWFPETAQLLALKGAEIILFPNAGYEPKIVPARAIDNNVYVVVASLGGPAMTVYPLGDIMDQTMDTGFIITELDLNERPIPHPNAGGTMMSSGGGKRAKRNSSSLRIQQEIINQFQSMNRK